DYVIITAEDPRGELKSINEQIIAGIKNRKNLSVIDDRRKAISFAINKLAKKGDTVGIFGKGHERSMNLDGRREIPWSDKEAVKRVLHGQ
ncbi:UDP-N-acetylmuramoyl-L-alanyl-D-glutamate--2,6-diaminopimelate ligase, partial [Candidatus Daviesbacteria bacterium]|nr:UDP-N-acetylmuramoyl-L-alanyl-D-glutamate--2,6-diaminopimelate ligase [Candidatus Daviesbacteria bacterium]